MAWRGVASVLLREPARARLALLQRELCARSGARAATPLPLAAAWARPPGRGSRPCRQRLPAWRTAPPLSPPVHARPASCPLARLHATLRRSPRPASPALPPFSPRPAPAMLSFQYPDVYRDETSVSTPLSPRLPGPRLPQLGSRSPRLPRAAPRPLFAEPPGSRGAPPSLKPAGGHGPRAHARGQRRSAPRTDPRAGMGVRGQWAARKYPCVSK